MSILKFLMEILKGLKESFMYNYFLACLKPKVTFDKKKWSDGRVGRLLQSSTPYTLFHFSGIRKSQSALSVSDITLCHNLYCYPPRVLQVNRNLTPCQIYNEWGHWWMRIMRMKAANNRRKKLFSN